jgi:uncharacterized protein (UPF0262 family)
MRASNRIVNITLDERTVVRRNADIEHERKVAIYDLLEQNEFALTGGPDGPYTLRLGIEENRLAIDVQTDDERPIDKIVLPLTPFRRIIKEYFMVCESYFEAIKAGAPSRIEAIDMGRRGLHDDGSHLLQDRLEGKAAMDFDTARRLFTLICVLHIRG